MSISPERARRAYREHLHEPVTIRRITGTGSARTDEQYSSMARIFRGDKKDLVSGISQMEMRAIVDVTQLVEDGLSLPVTTADYLIDVNNAVEYSVTEIKPRRVQAELIAYDLTLRGP